MSHEHTMGPQDKTEAQPAPGWPWVILTVLFFVMIFTDMLRSCSQAREQAKLEAAAKATAEAKARLESGRPSVGQTEALVLRFEGLTPCSTRIAWPFRIQRDGKDIQVKWPGVREPVTYSGEGDTVAPPEMRSGDTKFVSPDPSNPHVRVRVYERIRVRA